MTNHRALWRTHTAHVVSFLVLLLSAVEPALAGAQPALRTPAGVSSPTERRDCQALTEHWAALAKDIGQKHQACITQPARRGGGRTCSRVECQELHDLMTALLSGEHARTRRAQEAACWEALAAHEKADRDRRLAADEAKKTAERVQREIDQVRRAAEQRFQQTATSRVAAPAKLDLNAIANRCDRLGGTAEEVQRCVDRELRVAAAQAPATGGAPATWPKALRPEPVVPERARAFVERTQTTLLQQPLPTPSQALLPDGRPSTLVVRLQREAQLEALRGINEGVRGGIVVGNRPPAAPRSGKAVNVAVGGMDVMGTVLGVHSDLDYFGQALREAAPAMNFQSVLWSGNLVSRPDNRAAINAIKGRLVDAWKASPSTPINIVAHSHGVPLTYHALTELAQSRDVIERSVQVNSFISLGTVLHADNKQFFDGAVIRQPPNLRVWQNIYSSTDALSGAVYEERLQVVNHAVGDPERPWLGGTAHSQYYADPEVLREVLTLTGR